MTQKILKFAAAMLLISGSLNSFALNSDRMQPIAIEADSASLDQKNQVTVFSGNVLVKQGSIHIRAANVRVTQDKSGNQTMTAQGSPVYFRQQLDGDKGLAEGWGNRVEYSSATHLVKLISYNTQSEVYTVLGGNVTGNKHGRRVSIIIQPSTKK